MSRLDKNLKLTENSQARLELDWITPPTLDLTYSDCEPRCG